MSTSALFGSRFLLFSVAFVTMATAIIVREPKWLSDFDQSFYITIAYDLVHHHVFSNGVFDDTDSTKTVPPPGRFFGPVYPALIAAAMKLDSRFASAVDCSVEANHKVRDGAECQVYALPMHIAHAALLALGVLALAVTGKMMFASTLVFWLTGGLAILALLPDADLFSFVMTESAAFSLYSVSALCMFWFLQEPRSGRAIIVGLLLGLLILTRPSFLLLALVFPVLVMMRGRGIGASLRRIGTYVAAFAIGLTIVVGPWLARNKVSVGHWGLTEEYGSLTLIERFAFNNMNAREFLLAFPYCLPAVGKPLVTWLASPTAMDRFVYNTPHSFFAIGRSHRLRLVEAHRSLDPLITDLALDELRRNWWRHLLVSIPLAWCGMWVGGLVGLLLLPLAALACFRLRPHSRLLFMMYLCPPLVMLAAHAAVANHYTRYNLILIGPFSIGAAWMMARVPCCRSTRR